MRTRNRAFARFAVTRLFAISVISSLFSEMPRITRISQKQIDFPSRKTRSRTTDSGNERSRSRAKPTCSTSPRKRRDPVKEAEPTCNTLPAVSPKKKKNVLGKAEDLVYKDTENVQPKRMLCLTRQDGHHYSTVRKALHSSHPDNLLCREKELAEMKAFLENHLPKGKPGSLYISGAPGTGKTACLTKIMWEFKADIRKCKVIFVNCMALQQPQAIFGKIADELVGKSNCPAKATQKFLEEKFTDTSSKQTKIIILDEMDQLESKNQEILYTMFEWPSLPKSKLILIGIANALDLTDRILPRLQARPKCKPELLHFAPYTREQIVKILQDRLSGVEAGNNVLDAGAIQFCARKISAVAGDVRKALDICRRAVEVLEAEERKQQILTPVQKVESPTKSFETPVKPKKVGISQIASVVAEVYGSRMVVGPGVEQPTIPLQQKLLICTFLLMTKDKKTKDVTLGKFHDIYCKICNKRKVAQLGQEDFIGLCNILETRGLLGIKRAKDNRLMKVTLKIDEKEVDYALQDKTLLSSILQEGV